MRKMLGFGKAGILIAFLIVFTVVGAVGCEEELTPEEARAEACTALMDFEASLGDMVALGPGATVGDLRAAADEVQASFSDFEDAAAQVAEAQAADLKQAYDQLQSTIQQIPDDATIQEALTMIQPDLAAVEAEWQSVFDDLNCGEMPTGSPQGSPEGSPEESPEASPEGSPEESPGM